MDAIKALEVDAIMDTEDRAMEAESGREFCLSPSFPDNSVTDADLLHPYIWARTLDVLSSTTTATPASRARTGLTPALHGLALTMMSTPLTPPARVRSVPFPPKTPEPSPVSAFVDPPKDADLYDDDVVEFDRNRIQPLSPGTRAALAKRGMKVGCMTECTLVQRVATRRVSSSSSKKQNAHSQVRLPPPGPSDDYMCLPFMGMSGKTADPPGWEKCWSVPPGVRAMYPSGTQIYKRTATVQQPPAPATPVTQSSLPPEDSLRSARRLFKSST